MTFVLKWAPFVDSIWVQDHHIILSHKILIQGLSFPVWVFPWVIPFPWWSMVISSFWYATKKPSKLSTIILLCHKAVPLQWHRNEHDCISNHWHLDVCSAVYSGADQRKDQSSVSLAFVRGIHQWPVDSSHKGPLTQKMFPFDDIIVPQSSFSTQRGSNAERGLQGCCNVFKWWLPQMQVTIQESGTSLLGPRLRITPLSYLFWVTVGMFEKIAISLAPFHQIVFRVSVRIFEEKNLVSSQSHSWDFGWWSVSIGSGNGLVPSGNESLPEPILTKFYDTTWHH